MTTNHMDRQGTGRGSLGRKRAMTDWTGGGWTWPERNRQEPGGTGTRGKSREILLCEAAEMRRSVLRVDTAGVFRGPSSQGSPRVYDTSDSRVIDCFRILPATADLTSCRAPICQPASAR
ncbi:hypothetical protein SKAU_G00111430 [Synaphobranchus kaupii]|uniref:Uncharacterized protein n=1 Tax=Synaphobranchus kaupii TaxID=118154 RepID=A0A9Q1J699_SYNKA|nr:hypothetical protein SKAU_G00111430 [Synaphobranchus kaupii]